MANAKKVHVSVNALGAFAFDEKENLIDFVPFKKKADFIAKRLEEIENGKETKEEQLLINKLKKKGYYVERDDKAEEILRKNFRDIALKIGFKSDEEINQILSQAGIIKTRKILGRVNKEKILMRVINIIDHADKELNIFSEQMREWYGLYFPAAPKNIKSNELFMKIASMGRKENIKEQNIANLDINSSGMDFSDEDIEVMQGFAATILNLFSARKKLDSYLKEIAKSEMPNMTAILGHLLAARLVSMAGGLEKLARMPTSRIQLLGAEKALFRHMKNKAKAPKHGIIFAHASIQQAPKEKRGKIARILASKISIAAKIDFFSKEDRSKKLKKELEKELERI